MQQPSPSPHLSGNDSLDFPGLFDEDFDYSDTTLPDFFSFDTDSTANNAAGSSSSHTDLSYDTPALSPGASTQDSNAANCHEPVDISLQLEVPQPDLLQAELPQAEFLQADLPQAELPQADLPQADLPQAELPPAELPPAELPPAELPQANTLQSPLHTPMQYFALPPRSEPIKHYPRLSLKRAIYGSSSLASSPASPTPTRRRPSQRLPALSSPNVTRDLNVSNGGHQLEPAPRQSLEQPGFGNQPYYYQNDPQQQRPVHLANRRPPQRYGQQQAMRSRSFRDRISSTSLPAYVNTDAYAGVEVYEARVHDVVVMRRTEDDWMNATQILKVAGVDKGRRAAILRQETMFGEHEVVRGGSASYQGTWFGYHQGRDLCRKYGVEELLRPLLEIDPSGDDGDISPADIDPDLNPADFNAADFNPGDINTGDINPADIDPDLNAADFNHADFNPDLDSADINTDFNPADINLADFNPTDFDVDMGEEQEGTTGVGVATLAHDLPPSPSMTWNPPHQLRSSSARSSPSLRPCRSSNAIRKSSALHHNLHSAKSTPSLRKKLSTHALRHRTSAMALRNAESSKSSGMPSGMA